MKNNTVKLIKALENLSLKLNQVNESNDTFLFMAKSLRSIFQFLKIAEIEFENDNKELIRKSINYLNINVDSFSERLNILIDENEKGKIIYQWGDHDKEIALLKPLINNTIDGIVERANILANQS